MCQLKLGVALLAVLATVISLTNAQINPVVLFSGSKILRPGRDFSFSVTSNVLKATLSANFTFSGTAEGGLAVEMHLKNQKLRANSFTNFKFNTSLLSPGSYELKIDVYDIADNASYQDVQQLTYRKKKFSAFFYTDKGMYKGGDTVKFSIFSVDSETKPFNPKLGTVTITDPEGIKIKSFANVTLVKGKFKGSFELIDLAAMGVWNLKFQAEGETFYKNFEVKEYVLPTYSVNVDLPERASIPDATFPVTVRAIYTFGEAVEGEAVVTFYTYEFGFEEVFAMEGGPGPDAPMEEGPGPVAPIEGDSQVPVALAVEEPIRVARQAMMIDRPWWGPQVRRNLFVKTVQINSAAVTFEVNIASDLRISSEKYVNVEVVFTEGVTKKTAAATGNVFISQFSHELFMTGSDIYLPNQLYNLTVSARRIGTGTPAPANTPIKVFFQERSNCIGNGDGTWTCPSNTSTFNVLTDASGSVNLQYATQNFEYFYISASSPVATPAYKYPQKPQNVAVGTLDVVVLTKKPQIGSPVNIQLRTSSSSLSRVSYHMIAKGVLVSSRNISFVNQSAVVTFTPNFANAPKTEVVFFFVGDDGNIVSKQTTLSFSDLPNFVDLELSSNITKPGKSVTMKVSSLRFSTVAIFGQDVASKLLRSGNDFQKTDVFNDLSQGYDYVEWNWNNRRSWRQYEELQNFENVNLFVVKREIVDPANPVKAPEEPEYFRFAEDLAMEGPMAMEGGQAAGGPDAASPQTRKDFSEVVDVVDVEVVARKMIGPNIFDNKIGEANVTFKIPESITTFEFSAVSMNDQSGLGLTQKPASLRIFLNFFLKLTMPYQCKRAETVSLSILAFNYLPSNQNVTISIARNDREFSVVSPSLSGWRNSTTRYWQTFESQPNKIKSFKIVVRAKILGFVNIKVDAIGSAASDSLLQPLKVIAEGIPKSITQSVLIMKNDSSSTFFASLQCILPPTAVKDTRSAFASVAGDLLGPMISGLENLIQMSYGCGEQNLLNFVPSIVALRYLESTNQLTGPLKAKAISFAEAGYQLQLTYRRNDNSFSAFGQSDASGSTWLTAFSVFAFDLASPYITIDSNVLSTAYDYFVSKQNTDGSFREDGNVIHKDMQGGSSDGLPLTAFVSIVLSRSVAKFPQFISIRDKALDFIALNINKTDVYALCISTLALQLGNHAGFAVLYPDMIASGIETADQLEWKKPVVASSGPKPYWDPYQQRSVDIEMTSYALQVLSNTDITKAVKAAKNLVSRKNAYGGYGSTQDTVQALFALSIFGVKFNNAAAGTINVRLTPNLGSVINAQVNKTNLLVVQEFVLNPMVNTLNVSSGVNSTGSAIVSLTCKFNEVSAELFPRFNIRTNSTRSCKTLIKQEVCISYIPKDDDAESNMALVKMTLPSGYVYDNDQIKSNDIKLLETSEGGSTINAYFDSFTSTETCFIIQAVQQCVVENFSASTIEVTDYYSPEKKSQILYNIPSNLPACKDLPPM